MVRRISEAARGTGEAVNALDELGVSAQRLASMSPDQQFSTLADAMAKVKNQGDRVRLSMKLFDSEGVALVNTLRLGSKGLIQYEKDAKRLNILVAGFEGIQIQKTNEAFGRMGKLVEGAADRRCESVGQAGEATEIERAVYFILSTELRREQLTAEPLCRHCKEQGTTREATRVDDILPRVDRPNLELSIDNTQSLCESCHNRKTMEENRGKW